MYKDDENDGVSREPKKLGSLLGGYLARIGGTKKEQEEYAFYVNEAAKLTRSSYIVMHKRIERMFGDASASFVLSNLRDWVVQVQKSGAQNPAALFNWYLKQYRERNAPKT